MTDQEIVDGLINRDKKMTEGLFNIKYRCSVYNLVKMKIE